MLTTVQIVRPTTAFVIVDVQNDFISGSLAIMNCPAGQNGEDVGDEDDLLPGLIIPSCRWWPLSTS